MSERDDVFYCAHNIRSTCRGGETYGRRIKVHDDHTKAQGAYHCRGGGEGCAVYDKFGCHPKTAECRYALNQEPARGSHGDPRIVKGVFCPGADLCVRDDCAPEPKFWGEW